MADTSNNRIQKFTSDGVFLAKWGTEGEGEGQFSFPRGLALSRGIVYVADIGNHRIQVFTSGEPLPPRPLASGAVKLPQRADSQATALGTLLTGGATALAEATAMGDSVGILLLASDLPQVRGNNVDVNVRMGVAALEVGQESDGIGLASGDAVAMSTGVASNGGAAPEIMHNGLHVSADTHGRVGVFGMADPLVAPQVIAGGAGISLATQVFVTEGSGGQVIGNHGGVNGHTSLDVIAVGDAFPPEKEPFFFSQPPGYIEAIQRLVEVRRRTGALGGSGAQTKGDEFSDLVGLSLGDGIVMVSSTDGLGADNSISVNSRVDGISSALDFTDQQIEEALALGLGTAASTGVVLDRSAGSVASGNHVDVHSSGIIHADAFGLNPAPGMADPLATVEIQSHALGVLLLDSSGAIAEGNNVFGSSNAHGGASADEFLILDAVALQLSLATSNGVVAIRSPSAVVADNEVRLDSHSSAHAFAQEVVTRVADAQSVADSLVTGISSLESSSSTIARNRVSSISRANSNAGSFSNVDGSSDESLALALALASGVFVADQNDTSVLDNRVRTHTDSRAFDREPSDQGTIWQAGIEAVGSFTSLSRATSCTRLW